MDAGLVPAGTISEHRRMVTRWLRSGGDAKCGIFGRHNRGEPHTRRGRGGRHGLFSRFEEFRTSLGVAPSVLTDRLNRLVDEGSLELDRKAVVVAHIPKGAPVLRQADIESGPGA
jgi:hypothetical protein